MSSAFFTTLKKDVYFYQKVRKPCRFMLSGFACFYCTFSGVCWLETASFCARSYDWSDFIAQSVRLHMYVNLQTKTHFEYQKTCEIQSRQKGLIHIYLHFHAEGFFRIHQLWMTLNWTSENSLNILLIFSACIYTRFTSLLFCVIFPLHVLTKNKRVLIFKVPAYLLKLISSF